MPTECRSLASDRRSLYKVIGRQRDSVPRCLFSMPNAHTISHTKLGGHVMPQEDGLIAALKQTPLWNAFYKRMRRTTRFPRYYRKDLNW